MRLAVLLLPALLLPALLMARPSPGPPLCRVRAAALGNLYLPALRTVSVQLKPGCPVNGHAWVRLRSEAGATDPVYGWIELTADTPSHTFLGALSNWHPEWEAESGLTYRVPEKP